MTYKIKLELAPPIKGDFKDSNSNHDFDFVLMSLITPKGIIAGIMTCLNFALFHCARP